MALLPHVEQQGRGLVETAVASQHSTECRGYVRVRGDIADGFQFESLQGQGDGLRGFGIGHAEACTHGEHGAAEAVPAGHDGLCGAPDFTGVQPVVHPGLIAQRAAAKASE